MEELATRFRRLPGDVQTCLGFFSRIPVKSVAAETELRDAAGAWPAAGLAIVVLPALCLALSLAGGVTPLVSSAIAVGVLAAVTGGLHEDGLADTADGFGGGQDREAKISIMGDSRIGTYGTLALVFSSLIRVSALAGLAVSVGGAVAALVGVAVFSRALAVWHWHELTAAKAEGLAAATGRPDIQALWFALVWAGLALIFLIGMFGGAGLFAGALAGLLVFAFNRLCRHQIGGHTGDTIGASLIIAECGLYAGLSASVALAT